MKSPQPGGRSPQDLVDAVDRLEAEEDEADRELNAGIMPNGSRDLDEVRSRSISMPRARTVVSVPRLHLESQLEGTETFRDGMENNRPAVTTNLLYHLY